MLLTFPSPTHCMDYGHEDEKISCKMWGDVRVNGYILPPFLRIFDVFPFTVKS